MCSVDSQTQESSGSNVEALPWAAFTSSVLVKRASNLAFAEKKRAMTSLEVLRQLGQAFEEMME